MFDREQMIDSIPRFLEIWSERPFPRNPHGMGVNHCWATWYLIDQLQPELVIESGVWRGRSTWLIEQAAPKAEILAFDIDLSNRKYVSDRAQYFEYDLSQHDWSNQATDSALVFLDDHQDAYQRLVTMDWLGFHRIIFEDNHPVGYGDFYTLKYLRSASGYPVARPDFAPGVSQRVRSRVAAELAKRGIRQHPQRLVPPGNSEWRNTQPHITQYFEMPALRLDPTGYYQGMPYEDLGERPDELIPDGLTTADELTYNWLTYVELRSR